MTPYADTSDAAYAGEVADNDRLRDDGPRRHVQVEPVEEYEPSREDRRYFWIQDEERRLRTDHYLMVKDWSDHRWQSWRENAGKQWDAHDAKLTAQYAEWRRK